jgi:diguanylate cyclase (GGDEF)-like protein
MNNQDELTGLLNITAFVENLDALTQAGESVVLVCMDLDHFLGFNEKYGHAGGDAWLKAIAALFAETFQSPGSLVGRYGGDEFVAAMPSQDLFAVYEQAEALRRRVETDYPSILVDGQPVTPGGTITLALAAYPANAGNTDDLIKKGEQAMRRAKIAGGNQVSFYQETDTLTGLAHSYASLRALEEALQKARPAREPVSVFLMDIDHFKEINEEYGHRAGDEVLKRLGHILETNFKDLGTVGRTSGDEFIVILPGKPAESAFILAEEVRRLVDDSELQMKVGSATARLRFHISGGIATFPTDASERVDLLRKADEGVYRSKAGGRNRISLPASSQMITKTSYYTQIQLERLAEQARKQDKTEAFLLREALDDLLQKYKESGD